MKKLLSQTKLHSLNPTKLSHCNREAIRDYFENTWQLYEFLFSSIKSDETYYLSPDPLRNPLVFYLGHTAAFYINKFKLAGLIDSGVNEKYDQLFAVGVDPDLPKNLEVSAYWPSIDQVRGYRQAVYKIIHQVIDQIDEKKFPVHANSSLWAIPMTIEHDRIHFETSSVLIRQLSPELVSRPDGWQYADTFGKPVDIEWIEVKDGIIQLGKPLTCDLFGWDNEYGQLTLSVKKFQATKNLISNADFLAFVKDQGYANQSFWTEEGRQWKNRTRANHPKFWIEQNGIFYYRAMFDEVALPLDWPVEVNAHEAQAYCNWKNDGSRLLTEAEFNLIAQSGKYRDSDPLFSGDHNLNFVYGSPTPVGYLKDGKTTSGFNDIYGNAWDWLSNNFDALPGFATHPYYEDFSAPYMDTDHGMMAGGSWITTGTGASKYYRLWFRRHFFQHAGFRLAKDM